MMRSLPTPRLQHTLAALLLVSMGGCSRPPAQQQTESASVPAPAAVIVAPADGAMLTGPDVTVELAAEHITLAPAGTMEPNTGHLHLFLNHDLTPEGEVVPTGEGIVHLGQAQTTHVFQGLQPGDYTVIAVLADGAHVRLSGAATDTVRFMVH
jgi:hypothetical protein